MGSFILESKFHIGKGISLVSIFVKLAIKINNHKAREMALVGGKGTFYEYTQKDLNLDSIRVAHAYNSSTWDVESGGVPGAHWSATLADSVNLNKFQTW